jgi:hypothetical protein
MRFAESSHKVNIISCSEKLINGSDIIWNRKIVCLSLFGPAPCENSLSGVKGVEANEEERSCSKSQLLSVRGQTMSALVNGPDEARGGTGVQLLPSPPRITVMKIPQKTL